MKTKFLRRSTPLAVLALAVLAVWPVLRYGPPNGSDGQLHFYRLAELDWAVQHGQIYPRWLPDMGYGFGMPVFNFYPPLSYWMAEVWALLGLPLPTAMQLGYLLAFIVLLGGAYVWAQALFDSPVAGLAAAVAYGFAPYMFMNLLHRSAYPEVWGLALAPWCFWAVLRLARCVESWQCLAAALRLALLAGALVMLHALSAFMIVPLLLLYLLVLLLGHDRLRARLQVLWAGGAFGLAGGLSAVFWWPVLREEQFVQLSRTVSAGTLLDFRNNFPSLVELFGPPQIFDPLRTFNAMHPGISWVVLALALWGLISQRNKLTVRMAAGLSLGLTLLALPVSMPVWESVPLLRFIQFPWRLAGPLSLMLALLAGAGVAALRWRNALLGFTLAVVTFALPWTFGAPPLDLSDRTHADIPAYEQATGQLGTTATGEYLSIWAARDPDPAALADAYATGALPPARLDRSSLPAGVQVLDEVPGFDHTSVTYRAETEFQATFYWLFFPDVQAEVAGEPLSVLPHLELGLVQVADVPAGEHTLIVRQVASRPQRLGAAVSGVSVLLAFGLLVLAWRHRPQATSGTADIAISPATWPAISVALLALALVVLRLVWLDVRPSPFYNSRLQGDTIRGTTPQAINFGDRLQLIGVQVADDAVDLYWRPLADLDTDYSVAVFYVDAADYRYGQHDNQHPGPLPSSRWQLTQYAQDSHPIAPLPGTPPGDYRLLVSVYSAGGALEVLAETGPAGQLAEVGMFTVPPAARQPTIDDLAPQTLSGAVFDTPSGTFTLLGYDIDRALVTAGQPFYVTLYWRAAQSTPAGTLAEISLGQGAQTISASIAPLTTRTGDWTAGEVARGPQRVPVPPDMPGGAATIVLRVADIELVLGEIEIVNDARP